jgi:excisionase family DNA binding protein
MPDSRKRRSVSTRTIETDCSQLTLEDWVQMLEEDAASLQSESRAPQEPPSPSAASASETQLVSGGVALLTTREVADALHVHPRTVQRLVERGELAVVRLGAAIRFDPAELVRLIAERTRTARSPESQPDTGRRPRPSGVSFAKRLRSQPA